MRAIYTQTFRAACPLTEEVLLTKIQPPIVEGLLGVRRVVVILHALSYLNFTYEIDSLIIPILHIRKLKVSDLLNVSQLAGGAEYGSKVSLSPTPCYISSQLRRARRMSSKSGPQSPRSWLKCRFLGSVPDLLGQTLRGWGLGISMVTGPLGFRCTQVSNPLDKTKAERMHMTRVHSTKKP